MTDVGEVSNQELVTELRALPAGAALCDSSILTRKFYERESNEPLVMRIFLRNATTRLGGGEAINSMRRTVLD